MYNLSDPLLETGLKDRLHMIREIAGLIQFTNLENVMNYCDSPKESAGNPLYFTGQFIERTIEELFQLVDKVESESRAEYLEMEANLPPGEESETSKQLREARLVHEAMRADLSKVARLAAVVLDEAKKKPEEQLTEAANE